MGNPALPKNELLCPKNRGHRSQWNSAQMNHRHKWQLKNSKSWRPFWSYLLNSTDNPALLPQKCVKEAELECNLAGSSKMAPRFQFFQLPLVPNHHFIWNSLLYKPLQKVDIFLTGVSPLSPVSCGPFNDFFLQKCQ